MFFSQSKQKQCFKYIIMYSCFTGSRYFPLYMLCGSYKLPIPHVSPSITWDVVDSAKVFQFGWWMGQYGSITPKRHRGYTNNVAASKLDLGIYKRSKQAKVVQTVRKYKKKDGSTGYVGTSHLKSTQSAPHFAIPIGEYPPLEYRFFIHEVSHVP